MSSVSSIGSSSSLDTAFAQSLITQSGSSDGTLSETQFVQMLKDNPQLAEGLASAEGGDSSTTVDQLYQKLSDGDGSISLSELSSALGTLRTQLQQSGQMPPPPPPAASASDSSTSTSSSVSTSSDISTSTAVGSLSESTSSGIGALGDFAPMGPPPPPPDSSSSDSASSTSSSVSAVAGTSSDQASVVAMLEQLFKQGQTRGYNAQGASSGNSPVSFFETTS